jgi:photosystem II stability/assembly factor-like uncharacterized protein
MTDVDRMTDQELRLRDELRRRLVPPPTPPSLVASVEAMAATILAAPAPGRWAAWKETLVVGTRGLRLAGAIAAVLVVAVAALVALSFRSKGEIAAPVPTLPAFTGPTLPSPAATPTLLASAWWIDPDTAIALLRDRPTFRISADGGQTWSEERALPGHDTDLGFGFTDATHGYSMWTEGADGDPRAFVVDLTDDGGRTWRKVTAGSLPASVGTDVLGNVHFSDAAHGIALGTLRATATEGTGFGAPVRCAGWVTADGGATWTEIANAPCLWMGITWPTPTLGYLLANRQLWTTTDGGRTWALGLLPDQGTGVEIWAKTAVLTPGGAIRFIGGTIRTDGDTAPPLVVWDSEDGGATWRESMRDPTIRMTEADVTALEGDHWLMIQGDNLPRGDGSVFRESIDGGRTWTEVGRVDLSGGVAWVDRLHGTLQGVRQPASGEGYITTWLTNDGGRTWVEVPF